MNWRPRGSRRGTADASMTTTRGSLPRWCSTGPGATIARGLDALRAHYATALTAFPDLVITTEQIVVDLDASSMASRQIEVGTHTGDLVTPQGTLPPTGRTMSMSGAIFAKVDRDGLIVEMFEYFDRLTMTEQLLGPG